MITHTRPKSADDRLTFLLRCRAASDQDLDREKALLTDPTRQLLASLAERFHAAMQAVAAQKQQEAVLREQLDQAMGSLNRLLRENWQQLRIQYQYGRVDRQVVESYGLDGQARLPRERSRDALLKQAGRFVAGDAAALGRGNERFATAEEIRILYGHAKGLREDQADAERKLTEAIGARQSLHAEVDDLCTIVRTELFLALRHKPVSYRRQIMRYYGLRFRGEGSADGAVVRAPDAAAPTAEGTGITRAETVHSVRGQEAIDRVLSLASPEPVMSESPSLDEYQAGLKSNRRD